MYICTIHSMCLVNFNWFQILRNHTLLLQLPILMCSCLVSNVFYTSQILRHGWWAYPSTILCFLCYWYPCIGISVADFVLYYFSCSLLASHVGSSTCTQRTGRRFVCQRDQEKWSPSLQSCVTARTGSQGVDTQVGSLHSKLWQIMEGGRI